MSAAVLEAASVMQLTGRHIEKVNKDLRVSARGGWLARAFSQVFGALVTGILNKDALRMEDSAIWFKGAARFALEANLDPRDELAAMLLEIEKLKASMQRSRAQGMELRGHIGSSLPALDRVLAAQADLFEAVEAFRWTLLELQANHSTISEGYAATTPDGLDALFDRMAQEQ